MIVKTMVVIQPIFLMEKEEKLSLVNQWVIVVIQVMIALRIKKAKQIVLMAVNCIFLMAAKQVLLFQQKLNVKMNQFNFAPKLSKPLHQ